MKIFTNNKSIENKIDRLPLLEEIDDVKAATVSGGQSYEFPDLPDFDYPKIIRVHMVAIPVPMVVIPVPMVVIPGTKNQRGRSSRGFPQFVALSDTIKNKNNS